MKALVVARGQHPLRRDLQFRHLNNRFLQLGACSIGELLFEIARDHGGGEGEMLARLERAPRSTLWRGARADGRRPLLEVAL